MADDKFILNVDDDWKRQAQEEKRRLAEQEQKAKQAQAATAAPTTPAAAAVGEEEVESAEEGTPFGSLINTLLTQSLIYLGAMGSQRGMPMMNLDAARKSIDMLGALDEKTRGNLSASEQKLLDTALYQARNQFVSVASQYIGP